MENMKRLLEYRKPRTGELLSFKNKQYYVTDTGQIWNGELKRFMALFETHKYLSINLTDDNGHRHTCVRVHDLVASVFLRLLTKGEEVHHRDHCKTNNKIENLEIIVSSEHHKMHWKDGTMDGVAAQASERSKKAWKDGLMDGISEYRKKAWVAGTYDYQKKQVAQFTKDGQLIKVWPSTHEAGRNGYISTCVAACCRGKHKTHKGFKWMYLSNYEAQKEERQELEALASSS